MQTIEVAKPNNTSEAFSSRVMTEIAVFSTVTTATKTEWADVR